MTLMFALLTIAFGAWFVRSARRFGAECIEKNHGDMRAIDRMLWHMGFAFAAMTVSLCFLGVTLITLIN